ncbi:hypothetical protein ABPG72_020332 [Tetrahymena utriculariae]
MSVQVQKYLTDISPKYENDFITFDQFKEIINQMAKIDSRCEFNDEVIQQLYDFVFYKQNGQVCFGAVVGLTLEILKERTSYTPSQAQEFQVQNQNQKTLWQQVQLVIDQLTSDTLHQMKYIYEQCVEDLQSSQDGDSDEDGLGKKKSIDPANGVDMDYIIQKVEQMNSLNQSEKENIDFLFKCIQDDQGRVTYASLGDLMSLLEQYWINLVQQQAGESQSGQQNRGSTVIQNTQKVNSLTRLEDDDDQQSQNKKNEQDQQDESKQYYKYDYMQDLVHRVDQLKQMKGQKNQFYEILDDMFNNLLLLGTKLDSYEMELEQQNKKSSKQQNETMKLEQKVTYLETEMKRVIEYKDDLEAQLDNLTKEYDILEQKYAIKDQTERENQKTLENVSKLETQCAQYSRKQKELEQKNEQLKLENTDLKQESDKMYGLFQQAEEELDQIKQQLSQSQTSQVLSNIEQQSKSQTDLVLLQKLKDENRAIQMKLQILNDEAQKYKLLYESREEEYQELQRVHKQLMAQYEEACIVSRDKPLRLFNNDGTSRKSTRYSIKPLSGGFGRQSIRKSVRPTVQFGNNNKTSLIGIDNNQNQDQNGRISFNYSTRGSVFNEEIKQSNGNNFILNTENSIRSSIMSVRQSVNFDKFWDQFQNRMSIANQNGQLQKQTSQKEDQPASSQVLDPRNPQYYANFLAFDENELYARDFLGLRDNKKIQQILDKYSDVDNPNEMKCFSDSIYRINNSNERERRILFATPYNIFILHTRNFKVIRRIQIDRITKITFLNKSAYLCVISIKQEYDYLIETYRRADFNMFLMLTIKERQLVPYKIQFADEINIQFRGIKDKINIGQIDEKTLLNRFQASFKSAQMVGFLEICKHNWIKDFFSEPWKEYFFVLSNIGLVSFAKPGDSKPLLFIPINDALVIKDPAGQEKKFCIKIFYQNSNQHYILACQSKADQDKWLDSIRKVIYQSVNTNAKRDQIMKSQYMDPKDVIQEQDDEN